MDRVKLVIPRAKLTPEAKQRETQEITVKGWIVHPANRDSTMGFPWYATCLDGRGMVAERHGFVNKSSAIAFAEIHWPWQRHSQGK